jgi:hypothetical protein
MNDQVHPIMKEIINEFVDDKISFSRYINSRSGDHNNHGDCFFYGIMSGCDDCCPQYQRGECESGYDGK